MKILAGFAIVASLLVGLALGINLRPNVDAVATFNDGFLTALCAPRYYEDGSYVLEDGNGHLCVKP